MNDKIKIDIVSDVVCPWCIIGYKRLEKAIGELGIQDNVEVTWRPFELNPNMPLDGQNIIEHITEKYGSDLDSQKKSQQNLTDFGAELGFDFKFFDEMKIVNTRDAHILLDYAKGFGKQTELNLRFVASFYSEGKDISNRIVLLDELESVGLNRVEAEKRLESEEAKYNIIQEEKHWQQLGVSSVPTFVFEDMSAIPGAQPVEVFKNALTQMLEKQA